MHGRNSSIYDISHQYQIPSNQFSYPGSIISEQYNASLGHTPSMNLNSNFSTLQQSYSQVPNYSLQQQLISSESYPSSNNSMKSGKASANKFRTPQQTFYCAICGVVCSGLKIYQTHMDGKKHLNKLKANNLPVPKQDSNLITIATGNFCSASLKCELCSATFTSQALYESHHSSKRHQQKVRRKEIDDLKEMKDPSVYCPICDLLLDPNLMDLHMLGSKHQKRQEELSNPNDFSVMPKSPSEVIAKQQPNSKLSVNSMIKSGDISLEECHLCSISFHNPESALIHFHTSAHHQALSSYINPYRCELCDAVFTSDVVLNAHCQGFKHALRYYRGKEPEGPHREKILKLRDNMSFLKVKLFKRKMKQNELQTH